MDILSILVGGGILAFLEFLIQRHDVRTEKKSAVFAAIEKLDLKIVTLEDKIDKEHKDRKRSEVEATRTRILRFDDELRTRQKHSLEYFQEILRDIDSYEKYCDENPQFENTYAVDAVEHIKKVFRECKDENSFI